MWSPEDCSEGGRRLTRYRFVTPRRELSMTIEDAGYTAWVREPLIKEKQDIDAIGEFATAPKCDVEEVNRAAEAYGRARHRARPHLLLRRVRPARLLAGRLLPGGHGGR